MTKPLDAIILRYLGYALLFSFAAYLLYLVRGALPIFIIAALLAYVLEPVLKRLERKGYSRGGAVGFVFLIFLLVFILFVVLLATAWQQVQVLAQNLPLYQQQAIELTQQVQHKLDEWRLPPNVKDAIMAGVADFQAKAPAQVASRIQGGVGAVLSSIGLVLIVLVILPIVTLWFMLEMNPLRARLFMLVPSQYRRDISNITADINGMLGRYVRGQMIVCSLFGLLCTVVFYILSIVYGMQYPLVLGVLAALIYIVPYFGMAIIATAAGLTAYFTSSAPIPCAAIAVTSCLVFNLAIDYGITPRIVGKGVGLHPLMVIFAMLCGAQLGGIVGMVLAIPFFATLRVVAIHLFPQLTEPIPRRTLQVFEGLEEEVDGQASIAQDSSLERVEETITEVVHEHTEVRIVMDK